MSRTKILALGMLPPPVTGQALMFQRAIGALRLHYDVVTIDTQFQTKVGDAGHVSPIKILRFFLLFARIFVLSVTRRFDILYYCLAGPSRVGLIKDLIFLSLLRPRARKTIYHFHGSGGVTLLMSSNAILRAWGRVALCEPDLVLRPPSPKHDTVLCKAREHLVIDNGIDDPVDEPIQVDKKWPDAPLIFTYVGVVTEGKGVFELVEIACYLRKKNYQFTLNIVGDGHPSEVEKLRDLIERSNLEPFVRLTGVLIGKQKFELLKNSTIFLFPSHYIAEAQPTAIMEALAVGVPAVAYDWRGISSIIEHGVNGYLVLSGGTAEFSRAIERILTEGNIDSMRKAARRIFLERFTLEHHVAALLSAFRSVEVKIDEEYGRGRARLVDGTGQLR